ncbi:hypothetical protein HanRHA438_Chr08g0342321 [Helianthus annuus]|nr:hypothetical protein HanOQP8_Chr08g0280091 [Helianthus annuus]KAJ0897133.1 hypothetical protein HanRHA438_Chr08g0342321 [Helianthus annuus]
MLKTLHAPIPFFPFLLRLLLRSICIFSFQFHFKLWFKKPKTALSYVTFSLKHISYRSVFT